MSSLKEKILSFVKLKGPVLPVQINKETGRDSFFSGAILSELAGSKEVKISNAKVGGSPVYFVEGQEPKLSMLYDGLPMREKEAYNLLKEKKVIKSACFFSILISISGNSKNIKAGDYVFDTPLSSFTMLKKIIK